ncbi:translation initiation factor IF-2 [Flavihumibacter sp. ZG627]|uniref:translation initiation factor IF-2 n=1 Tax=Flavihumibacter sp. ZG627 TaxID=1463156 RepID=UPI000580697F|nr:translation initiation factor IF-2 [Flavihumibacter sp. ZG627]KIC92053.1 translation initiation factor IF-2 [Flavihumibacter sp. ZG627]
MAETTTPRLMAAAKEFNIGKDTLVDFLASKGFDREDLKPTSKLTEDMYNALQREFQGDKVAKIKSDQIDLPKGSVQDKKRKEDEDISIRKEVKKTEPVKEEKPVVVEATPAPVQKVEAPAAPEPVAQVEAPEPAPVEAPAPTPAPEAEPAPIVEATPAPVAEVSVPDATPVTEKPASFEGPKIIDKIDLSTIDSSTRPKKTVKKSEAPAPAAKAVEPPAPKAPKAPVAVPKEDVVAKEKTIENPPVAAPQEEPETPPMIENIQAQRLTGPKILGKIQLPVDSDTRPKAAPAASAGASASSAAHDEKRKRKRIPIDKKGENITRQQASGQQGGGGGYQGQQRPPGQGGGGGRFPRPQGPGAGGGRGPARPGQGAPRTGGPREVKEIDQKEIQEKIRQTQAKMAGSSGKGRSVKSRLRREKRQEMADQQGNETQDMTLQVTEFISVSELANLMDVGYADVIGKCMGLGMMVSINQRLDAEVIELVANEFGFNVEFIGVDDVDQLDEEDDEDSPDELQPRSPIVTIMGHVDHGKTSLLDYIRSANVVGGEAGGITQHIGAYTVDLPSGKKIAFLDTPGHEAFTAMRARGAKVTDIAVIVIAADDAVMPQTKEAISHAQAAGVPMIFAINKIDKDGANPQKIYEQLAGMNILVEEWGGKFQSQELSAKKGLNVDLLLEKILLEAEILDLKANPEREANGTIIEATLDKGRGYVATVLVQNGTLHQGDLVVSGQFYGRVKAMFNERNKKLDQAPPSTPVLILGLNGAPQAGETFRVFEDESEAKDIATRRAQILREQGIRTKKHITLDEIGRRLALGNFKQLNLIIKGDVDGSVEALSDSLIKQSTEEIAVSVVHKAVGAITESDVLLATASDAIIIGFNVRASSQAAKLAENEGVQIKTYSIIYNAIEEIRSAMEGMLEPKVQEKEVATVEIREVYKFDKATVAGCFVTEGKIKRDSKIRLFRDGVLIYPRTEGAFAELGSLKRFKDDVKEVNNNYECGLTLKNFADIQVGDTIVAIEEEEVKRTL